MSDSEPNTGKSVPEQSAAGNGPVAKLIAGQPLPDLYRLLSLKSLEPDHTVIENALRRLSAQVKSSQLADQRDATVSRDAKLLELGRRYLLSTEGKKQYDRQWRRVYGGSKTTPVDANTASKESETKKAVATTKHSTNPSSNSALAKLLPLGNPDEPFRLAEYLQSNVGKTHANYEADFEKLQSLLGSLNEQPTAMEKEVKTETEVDHSTRSVELRKSSFSQARQRRKQREQWILWGAIAGLAVVGSCLAWLFWANPSSNNASPPKSVTVAQNKVDHTDATAGDQSPADRAPRRSGLPSVAGVSSEQDLTQNIDAIVPRLSESSPPTIAPNSESSPPFVAPNSESSPPIVARLSESSSPIPSAIPSDPTKPMLESTTQPMVSQPELSDAERTAWFAAMASARQLIGRQEYTQANALLAENEQLAKTNEQRAHLLRLKTINRLAEELQQDLRKAIEGLGAGEVVMIGTSTPVAFVDWDQTQLTVRIRGENRKFALPELPIGLAFALSDMSLDAEQASTQARKAAFALVHPGAQGNDLAAERAKEMMSAAVAAGVVDQDLMNAFNE